MKPVVIVTGASSGIGRALALEWSKRGATVVLSARSEQALQKVADEIASMAGDALVISGDVTKEEDRKALIDKTMAARGRIDVLVNNAGRGYYAPALKVDPADLEALYRLNAIAPIRLAQLAYEPLCASKGTIVMISSVAGVVAAPRIGPYASSKFALEALSMALRAELRSTGVRVLVVRPGPVATPFHENAQVVGGTPERSEGTAARPTTRGGRTWAAESIGYRPPGHKAQSPETVAKMTVDAVDAKLDVLETSLFVKTASLAGRVAPGLMRRISKQMAAKSGF